MLLPTTPPIFSVSIRLPAHTKLAPRLVPRRPGGALHSALLERFATSRNLSGHFITGKGKKPLTTALPSAGTPARRRRRPTPRHRQARTHRGAWTSACPRCCRGVPAGRSTPGVEVAPAPSWSSSSDHLEVVRYGAARPGGSAFRAAVAIRCTPPLSPSSALPPGRMLRRDPGQPLTSGVATAHAPSWSSSSDLPKAVRSGAAQRSN